MQGGKDRTVVARRHALGILALLGCASLALAAEGRPAASQQSNASTAPEQAAPAGAPSIAPDQPAIQALAAKLAESIQESGKKTVLVFDFVGPGTAPDPAWAEFNATARKPSRADQWPVATVFGQTLATEFTAAVARSVGNINVVSWDHISQTLPPDTYFPDVIAQANTAWWIAQTLNFDLFVWGDLKAQHNGTLNLQVTCYEAQSGRQIKGLSVPIPPALGAANAAEASTKRMSYDNYPPAGQNGTTHPRCSFCPQAQYPQDALDHKFGGTVELVAIVGVDGRAKVIKILRALPFKLTQSAIQAVLTWRFEPARGADGKPVAVRQIIEVSFYLG